VVFLRSFLLRIPIGVVFLLFWRRGRPYGVARLEEALHLFLWGGRHEPNHGVEDVEQKLAALDGEIVFEVGRTTAMLL